MQTRVSLLRFLLTAAPLLTAACGGASDQREREACVDTAPPVVVSVDGRYLSVDATEVTNGQFADFVDATGYVTRAERGLPEARFDGLPMTARRPASAVFTPVPGTESLDPSRWWRLVEGASWRAPEGPGSTIEDRGSHPVVHVTVADAAAYAAWRGRRLPTAAEWEAAAGGPVARVAPDEGAANTWRGVFPVLDRPTDGHAGLAPVGCYPPGPNGLHDVVGNVWELTTTPAGNGAVEIRGGSYLCAANYCSNYLPQGREAQDVTLGTSHVGFRTVADLPAPAGDDA